MIRQEFTKNTKRAAWERSGGICQCGCGQRITTPEYDHWPVPAALGGSNALNNCRVLDKRCHRKLTAEHDTPRVKKATRVFEKRINAREKRRGFPKPPKGYDPWTRSMRND